MAYKQEIVLTKWVRSASFDDYTFIADKLLTVVNVDAPGKYYIFEKGGIRKIEDKVTIDGNSPTIERTEKFSEGTFAPVEHAINTFVRVNEADILNRSAVKRLEESVKAITLARRFNKEYEMKALLDASVHTKSVTNKWNTDGATIEKDIREAISQFREQAGVAPNTIVIPEGVWNAMVMDGTLSQRWTLLPGRKDQTIELKNLMGYLFDALKNIFVPVCMYNTGPRGNETEVDLWSNNNVYLLYIGGNKVKDEDNGNDIYEGSEKTFTWASIFLQKKETIGSWLSPNGKIKYIEITEAYDLKSVCQNAVLKIESVLS